MWERLRGVSKPYDAELDYKQRIEEMRGEWEERMQEKIEEKNLEDALHDDDEDFHDDVSSYFKRSTKSPNLRGMENEKIPPAEGLSNPNGI